MSVIGWFYEKVANLVIKIYLFYLFFGYLFIYLWKVAATSQKFI